MFNKWGESWKTTTRHLRVARALLPPQLTEYPSNERGNLQGFEEFLAHNELELALDQLEDLGESNLCSIAFWQELSLAAENMQLSMRAERYREKAGER